MISKNILYTAAGLSVVAMVGCIPMEPGPVIEGSTPPACASDVSVNSITVSSKIPCDYPDMASLEGTSLARFAWNTFIAMNWPAEDPFDAPYNRGVPDTSKAFGAEAAAVVWDTWREKRELFQIVESVKSTTGYKFAEPPAFNDGQPPSSSGPNPAIPMCSTVTEVPQRFVTALQSNKIENYLDETDEIGLAVLWRDELSVSNNTGVLAAGIPMPDDDNLVRYQVKFGPSHYSYVRDKNFWDPTVLNAAIKIERDQGNGIGVELPSGDNATHATGSILVKTAWMKLTSLELTGGDYYTQTALYYRKLDGKVCYDYDEFALIAIHVIRKTDKFPYFFFSTFQHTANYPGKFVYANTQGKARNQTDFSSTLKNPFGITYKNPADPTPNPANPTVSDPYHANRLIKALPGVVTANSEAATALAGTVWANYELVGFQYRPVDKPADTPGTYYTMGSPPTSGSPTGEGYYPNYYTDQEYYLANPVVETNQRFQFFEGGFGVTGTNNIAVYPSAVTPILPGSGNAIAPSIDMGGCMGCHGNTQSTDFSFTLGNATAEPKGFAAGTIEDVCAEIGLAYNGRNACQAKAP